MKLAAYIAQPGHTASALAVAVGTSVSTITRVARGEQVASGSLMREIFVATAGAVTPNDLVGIDDLQFGEVA